MVSNVCGDGKGEYMGILLIVLKTIEGKKLFGYRGVQLF